MAGLEIGIAIIAFLLYVVFRTTSKYLAHAYLFIIFIFAFVVSDKQFSIFYLVLFLIAIVLDTIVSQIDESPQTSIHQGKIQFSGWGFTLFSLLIGLVMYVIINLISRNVGGNIVGAPNFAVTTASDIGLLFKPTFQSMLGIIENMMTFVIFDLLLVFGIMIPLIGMVFELIPYLVPMLVTSLILAIFHVSAYSVGIGLMLYAMLAFMLFIVSKIFLHDSLSADTAHFTNNLVISASRSLAIA